MTKEQAKQVAQGYAWGTEDALGTETAKAQKPMQDWDRPGWMDFSDTYAQAWQDYNDGKRGHMMAPRHAYAVWQDSQGETIDREV